MFWMILKHINLMKITLSEKNAASGVLSETPNFPKHLLYCKLLDYLLNLVLFFIYFLIVNNF